MPKMRERYYYVYSTTNLSKLEAFIQTPSRGLTDGCQPVVNFLQFFVGLDVLGNSPGPPQLHREQWVALLRRICPDTSLSVHPIALDHGLAAEAAIRHHLLEDLGTIQHEQVAFICG